MTGYGKAAAVLSSGTLTLEIRSLNGKTCDINIKSSLLPKEKELSVRNLIAEKLQRGSIDLCLTFEAAPGQAGGSINSEVLDSYLYQIAKIADKWSLPTSSEHYIAAALRLPDVLSQQQGRQIPLEEWDKVQAALLEAIAQLDEFRTNEGAALYKDVTGRVKNILALEDEVESHEAERLEAVRERLAKNAAELGVKLDAERFEQEMIYYLEKLDINEEKVRLRQHCAHFMDTIDSDPAPGKKLGFIIQEMGREINTTGSKANNAAIQKSVVQMKDELEKIREQSMNIL